MKLRRFRIEGFKALASLDVAMPEDALIFIGMNGAGKSSALQALSLVRHFAIGRTLEFFEERNWQVSDIRPRNMLRSIKSGDRTLRMLPNRNLRVTLHLEHEDGDVVWDFTWGYAVSSPLNETIWVRKIGDSSPAPIISITRPSRASNEASDTIRLEDLKLGGSVLSALSPERLAQGTGSHILAALLEWAEGITSLELLSPVAMRRGVRGKPKDIGPRGERLAGFIAGLSASQREGLVDRVSKFYPLADLDAVRKTAGWIDMRFLEKYPDMARVSPTHMSDGFMRILALCTIPDFDDSVSVVLLDEVEDGIEPHILPAMIEYISKTSSCQFIMTSHSPLLVNYFDSQTLRFLARAPDGSTAIAKPSDLKIFAEGGEYFGVGEIWVNASSDAIAKEIASSSVHRIERRVEGGNPTERVSFFMDGM